MSETETSSSEPVNPEEARKLIASGEVRVFDIRSAEEFAEERIAGSIRVDPDDLEDEIGEKDGAGRGAVLLICGDGSQSAEAVERLRSSGTDVRCIDGGFEAWTGEGLPTAPRQDEEYEGPKLGQPGVSDSSDEEEDEEDGEEEKPPDSTRDVTERPVDSKEAEEAENA